MWCVTKLVPELWTELAWKQEVISLPWWTSSTVSDRNYKKKRSGTNCHKKTGKIYNGLKWGFGGK